jgi:dynactin-5
LIQDSGNKVSRRAAISGTPNITLAGKTVIMAEAQLRGDLTRSKSSTASSTSDPKAAKQSSTAIAIGRCTIVAAGAVIKPPGRMSRGTWTYYPMKIGDNVFIGMAKPFSAFNCI